MSGPLKGEAATQTLPESTSASNSGLPCPSQGRVLDPKLTPIPRPLEPSEAKAGAAHPSVPETVPRVEAGVQTELGEPRHVARSQNEPLALLAGPSSDTADADAASAGHGAHPAGPGTDAGGAQPELGTAPGGGYDVSAEQRGSTRGGVKGGVRDRVRDGGLGRVQGASNLEFRVQSSGQRRGERREEVDLERVLPPMQFLALPGKHNIGGDDIGRRSIFAGPRQVRTYKIIVTLKYKTFKVQSI